MHCIKRILLGLGKVSSCDSTISDSFNLGNRSLNHLEIKDSDYIHTLMLLRRFLSPLLDTHVSNSCSLGNGVDSKQSRVGIIGAQCTDLFNGGKKKKKIKRQKKTAISDAECNVSR